MSRTKNPPISPGDFAGPGSGPLGPGGESAAGRPGPIAQSSRLPARSLVPLHPPTPVAVDRSCSWSQLQLVAVAVGPIATAVAVGPSCNWPQLQLVPVAVGQLQLVLLQLQLQLVSCSWSYCNCSCSSSQLQLATVAVGHSCSWSQLQLVTVAVGQLQLVTVAVGRSCRWSVAVGPIATDLRCYCNFNPLILSGGVGYR